MPLTEQEIQDKLTIMTLAAKLVDRLTTEVNRGSNGAWWERKEAEERYMDAHYWLVEHGIQPLFDHEKKRYVWMTDQEVCPYPQSDV